jgi:hypothetical protein
VALVDAFGGEILPISSCAGVVQRWRNEEIRRLAADGWSTMAIAALIGVTDRTVRLAKAA